MRILNAEEGWRHYGATQNAKGFWVKRDAFDGKGIDKFKVSGDLELGYSDFDGDGRDDHKFTMDWSKDGRGSHESIRLGNSWIEVHQMQTSPLKYGRRTLEGREYFFQGSEWREKTVRKQE